MAEERSGKAGLTVERRYGGNQEALLDAIVYLLTRENEKKDIPPPPPN